MMDFLCSDQSGLLHYVLMIIYVAFEAWLGKTKKVEANSSLQLIMNILLSLKEAFRKKE